MAKYEKAHAHVGVWVLSNDDEEPWSNIKPQRNMINSRCGEAILAEGRGRSGTAEYDCKHPPDGLQATEAVLVKAPITHLQLDWGKSRVEMARAWWGCKQKVWYKKEPWMEPRTVASATWEDDTNITWAVRKERERFLFVYLISIYL